MRMIFTSFFLMIFPLVSHAKAPLKIDPSKSCTDAKCHADITKKVFLHGPVAVNQCIICHVPLPGPNHAFKDMGPEKELCGICHEPPKAARFPHTPIQEGKCLSCHDPHGGASAHFLKKDPDSKVCLDCHDPIEKKDHVHPPLKNGTCTACHRAHGGNERYLLDQKEPDFCFQCHGDMKAWSSKTRHPVKNDQCSTCHITHASDHGKLLKLPFEELCGSCHKNEIHASKNKDFPHRDFMKAKECLKCHDPHFSKEPKLLKGKEEKLCTTCHKDIAEGLKKAVTKHGPISEGKCTPCHTVHAETDNGLIKGKYTKTLYEGYQRELYSQCYSCHAPEIIENEISALKHGFRDGTKNLHFIHVHKETKGRTCFSCHEVHSSEQPRLIKRSFPFGQWNVPIEYKKTSDGGSCATGCHQIYSYKRHPEEEAGKSKSP